MPPQSNRTSIKRGPKSILRLKRLPLAAQDLLLEAQGTIFYLKMSIFDLKMSIFCKTQFFINTPYSRALKILQ